MIVGDVKTAVQEGHLCMIVTDRKGHCDIIDGLLGESVGCAKLYAPLRVEKMRAAEEGIADRSIQVVIATAGLLAEGWDCPRLSALFLAFPMSGPQRIEQIIGRCMRKDPEKLPPVVYDYWDNGVPMLASMVRKRQRLYRREYGEERVPDLPARAPRATGSVVRPRPSGPVASGNRKPREPNGQMLLDV
jgi:superfamily II DNA or RNA helicase